MEGLFLVKCDHDSGLPVEVEDGRPALQARSMANALKLCKRKLHQLREGQLWTKEDVEHYQQALDLLASDYNSLDPPSSGAEGKVAEVVSDNKAYQACQQLLEDCQELLREMRASCEALPQALAPLYDRLVGLRRRLQRMEQRGDHALQEVLPLQAQLDEVDADRVSRGSVSGEPGSQAGEHVCEELLNQCYDLLASCLRTANDIPPEMQRTYGQLRHIKNSLRRLSNSEHHTVEELQHYQAQLERLDARGLGVAKKRDTGGTREGPVPPQDRPPSAAGQLRGLEAAAKLLEECYDLVEGLMNSAVGMVPEVKAMHHKLEAYRHQLERLSQRLHTFQELLDIQVALNAVDDDRQAHAGVFSGHASSGRACSALLNHCYRMLHELYGSATSGVAEP
ncbi:hypothetical protein N2152v2_005268 [Parachlorella kessleri]